MKGGENNLDTYSYYFDILRKSFDLYDFDDKRRCLRDYVTYMLERTQKIFEYTGLPDSVPKRLLEAMLQTNGFACFAKVKGELYAFYGGLGGEPDEYYRPTVCVVSNPALNYTGTLKIGEDCVIVRNDSYLTGLLPMFQRYATAMVENDISFRMASINTRIEFLLSAPDDATKAAAEKFLEDIEDGKLGVIAENAFLDGIKAQEVGRSMRTFTDLIEYQQYLKASWFNEIGLNANYNMKREKLSTTESQMNNDALLPLVDDMLENRRIGLELVNEMFGTNIEVNFTSSWEKLVEEMKSIQVDSGEEKDDGSIELSGTDETSAVSEDSVGVSNEEHRTDGEDSVGQGEESTEGADAGESDGDSPDVEIEVKVVVEGGEVDENSEEDKNESDDGVREESDE